VRMQGQYGASTDKRLTVIVGEMWKQWGFRQGIMRGYWVRTWSTDQWPFSKRFGLDNGGEGNPCVRWVCFPVSTIFQAHFEMFADSILVFACLSRIRIHKAEIQHDIRQ
jgi:hypothetical protein